MGTAATRDFYNRVGWRRQNGTLVDTLLFGWADGRFTKRLTARESGLLSPRYLPHRHGGRSGSRVTGGDARRAARWPGDIRPGEPFPASVPLSAYSSRVCNDARSECGTESLACEAAFALAADAAGMDERTVREVGRCKDHRACVPSVQFDRRVSERTMIGRFAWRAIQWLETHHSDRAAWLGACPHRGQQNEIRRDSLGNTFTLTSYRSDTLNAQCVCRAVSREIVFWLHRLRVAMRREPDCSPETGRLFGGTSTSRGPPTSSTWTDRA